MRLIDADELMKLCDIMVEKYNIKKSTWSQFKAMVESMPTIDAVQVVRCKDCKYKSAERELAKLCWCCRKQRWDDREGFCSDGERREQ